jgi:tRNA nucleotidyltransferase (CCA-adding enzyme)
MSNLIRPRAVITAHMSADYDALSAMVAASKLYPDATLVAPTMLERQNAHLYADSIAYLFNLRQPKECDFSAVELLVVVDTHQISRVEHIRRILDNPGLKIHVYDHHPDTDNDLAADFSLIKPWGSTTAILVHLIQERGIAVTPGEATMMALGIYEDTGSFTFSSTTPHDFTAAAFLRASGMDMETVAEVTSNDLTREQVHILDTLLRNAVTHFIQGIPITITEITLDAFMGDFASLVQKLIDIENIKVIFALAAMGDRVHMIARSKVEDVDVGEICSSFGGSGHASAASASIKQPLAQTRAELLAYLASIISPAMTVGQHMTTPAVSIEDTLTIHQAEELMTRYGLKAVPVTGPTPESGIGLLEQQVAARAVAHQLGDLPVSDYMQRNISTLSPGADLTEAMRIILKQRQRLVPIMEGTAIVGVLTRTDVVRLLIDDALHIPEASPLMQGHKESNVASLVRDQLPEEHVNILKLAGELGDSLRMGVFAVGGFVRDLLLRQPNLDIDICVEGDGIAFADKLAAKLGGRMRPHYKFKTAVVSYNDSQGQPQRLDVATARLEYYEHPAALPTVELASIKMDLFRRDFTVNALAIQLNSRRFGMLIDPFGGQRDIKEHIINVLHSLSFVEDPTRILRAVRFERRFHFRIGVQTESLIKNALSLNMLEKLSGPRLFNELVHVFDEREATACIRRLDNWNLLRRIHRILKLNPTKDILLTSIEEVLAWHRLLYETPKPRNWVLYLMGLCAKAKYPDVAEMLDRLGIVERVKMEFLALREQTRSAANHHIELHDNAPLPVSVLYETLNPLGLEGLLYLMARHGHKHNIGQDVSLYLTRLKDVSLDISGEDLTAMGEQPGPAYGEVLKRVLAAKLDGIATTREAQLELAMQLLALEHDGPRSAALDIAEVLNGRT